MCEIVNKPDPDACIASQFNFVLLNISFSADGILVSISMIRMSFPIDVCQ